MVWVCLLGDHSYESKCVKPVKHVILIFSLARKAWDTVSVDYSKQPISHDFPNHRNRCYYGSISIQRHHNPSHSYLTGKSSCASAVMSGNKLAVENDAVSKPPGCYHDVLSSAPAVFCFFSYFFFPGTLHSFIFTIITLILIVTKRRAERCSGYASKEDFFFFFFFHTPPHQSMSSGDVLSSDRSIQLGVLSIIITVLLVLVWCRADVMVWPHHSHSDISRFVLQSVPSCQESIIE